MKYKLINTNNLNQMIQNGEPISKEDKKIFLSSIFDTFEEVVSKINADLTSAWNGKIPLPMEFKIEIASDEEESTSLKHMGNLEGMEKLNDEERAKVRNIFLTTDKYLQELEKGYKIIQE